MSQRAAPMQLVLVASPRPGKTRLPILTGREKLYQSVEGNTISNQFVSNSNAGVTDSATARLAGTPDREIALQCPSCCRSVKESAKTTPLMYVLQVVYRLVLSCRGLRTFSRETRWMATLATLERPG